jgi:hypothetical protein
MVDNEGCGEMAEGRNQLADRGDGSPCRLWGDSACGLPFLDLPGTDHDCTADHDHNQHDHHHTEADASAAQS